MQEKILDLNVLLAIIVKLRNIFPYVISELDNA